MSFLKIKYAVLILISGCAAVQHSDIESAKSAFDKEYYQTAIHFANQEIRNNPVNAEAYLISGKAYSRLNEKEKAFENFNTAVMLLPGFDTYFARALEFIKNNELSNGINDLTKAISYDDNSREAFFTRAYIRSLQDDFDGAIEDYKKTIEIDSLYYAAYLNMGNIYGRLGYEQESLKFYSRAINIQPENPDGYFNRASQKLIMNDVEGGIADIEKSLSLGDENINTLLLLAELKLKVNDNLASLNLLKKILNVDSDNPKVFFMIGVIYLRLEDKKNACDNLTRSGELGYFEAYEMINKHCLKTKNKK